jgi:hypothetical protein
MAHYEEIVTPTPKQIKVNKRRSWWVEKKTFTKN